MQNKKVSKDESLLIMGTTQVMKFSSDLDTRSSTYLGGNGIMSALAASKYTQVYLVSSIGSDLTKVEMKKRLGKNVHLNDVSKSKGKTFFYEVNYELDSERLLEKKIDFGVYKQFTPIVGEKQRGTKFVLFSGSRPQLGLEVLKQLIKPEVIAVDTMMYHLENNFEVSQQLISKANVLFINDAEYLFLIEKTGKNIFETFPRLQQVFKKNGKKGLEVLANRNANIFTRNFVVKDVVEVKNPVNAGDAISGTIMGLLAAGKSLEADLESMIDAAQLEARLVISDDPFYRKTLKSSLFDKN